MRQQILRLSQPLSGYFVSQAPRACALSLVASALLLAGCGGGGGGSGGATASSTVPTSLQTSTATVASTAGAVTAAASATVGNVTAVVGNTVAAATPSTTTPGTSPTTSAPAGTTPTTAPATTPTPTPTPTSTAPATTPAPAPAPAPASSRTVDLPAVRAAVLQVLQTERQRCGFSAIAQDANLDKSAVNHGGYLATDISNGNKGAHTETSGKPGFTGATQTDRARAAGYTPGSVNEAFAHSTRGTTDEAIAAAPAPTDRAVSHTKFLLSTVYHMLTLLAPRRDLGIGYAEQKGSASFTQVTVMELGVKSGSANLPQTDLLTYPCQGTAVLAGAFVPSKETPNPLPSVADATVGTPLYLRAPEGKVLVLRTYSITGPDGVPLAATVLDSSNDPAQFLTSAQVYVVPQKALVGGTSYQVNYSGTVDGTAFTRSFRFTPT